MRRHLGFLLLAAAACSDVRVEDDAGAGSAAVGGEASVGGAPASSSSGVGAGGEGAQAGAPAGAGGGGGAFAACGDAALDPNEECDDGDNVAGDGCSELCAVECSAIDPLSKHEAVWKDPVTHHCYRWAGGLAPDNCGSAMFAFAETDCATWGGDLAALSTLAERDAVVASGIVVPLAVDVFLGGRDLSGNGDFSWVNGEPWTYEPNLPPWNPGEPVGGTFLEIYSDGAFNADVDGTACGWVCERTPAGAP